MVLSRLGVALDLLGAEKAIQYEIHPTIAVLLDAITGVGGGCIRDVLMNRSPGVLHTDIYAAVMIISQRRLSVSPTVASFLGGVACFALRLVAVRRDWQLPQLG